MSPPGQVISICPAEYAAWTPIIPGIDSDEQKKAVRRGIADAARNAGQSGVSAGLNSRVSPLMATPN